MKFIDELLNHKNIRTKRILDKQKSLVEANSKLAEKQEEIRTNETLYKENFNETVFTKLKELKTDKEKLQYTVEGLTEQLDLMDIGELKQDPTQVIADIDEYVSEKLQIKEAFEAIDEQRKIYVETVKRFMAKVGQLQTTREEMDSLKDYMPKETVKACHDGLRHHYDDITRYNRHIPNSGPFYWEKVFNIPETETSGKELDRRVQYIYSMIKAVD